MRLRGGRWIGTAVATVLALALLAADAPAKSVGKPRRRAVDAVIVHSLGGPDCREGARSLPDASTATRALGWPGSRPCRL